ncbi:glycosyltransferase [Nocardia sp. CA-107356]|uniref:glycosyltransferase family 2 protein n=1 Tax=Nocardia sp. CA-107356 TaxID=3239972 RepID=UPI003D8BE3D9
MHGRSAFFNALSVVVPVLNEAAVIERTLQRLVAQEAIDEVIVVDNGSDDGTRCIVGRGAGNDHLAQERRDLDRRGYQDLTAHSPTDPRKRGGPGHRLRLFSEDAAEGVRAFAEKRAPIWGGR